MQRMARPDRAPSETAPTEPGSPRPARRFTPEADAACIAAVLSGQRDRFTELIERYQDPVYAVVLGYVRNRHAAEDVAQDVFLNAYTALASLRDPNYFYPWLLQIARHRAAQVHRRTDRRPDDTALHGQEVIQEQDDGPSLRLTEVMASVEQLPEPYRETVLLKYERNLSCKQIAEKEGVAVGTITSRLTRALSLLRTALTGKGEKQ